MVFLFGRWKWISEHPTQILDVGTGTVPGRTLWHRCSCDHSNDHVDREPWIECTFSRGGCWGYEFALLMRRTYRSFPENRTSGKGPKVKVEFFGNCLGDSVLDVKA